MKSRKNLATSEIYSWPKLQEYELSSREKLEFSEGGIEGRVGLLRKFKSNQFLVVCTLPASQKNIGPFEKYIDELVYLGLDVGKGNAEYGFKMPLPKKGDLERGLIIFRRQ